MASSKKSNGKAPSTSGGKDEGAVYGKGPDRGNRKGTLDGELKGSAAKYRQDPTVCYNPHDGQI